jgi:hypothetical protein
VIPEFLVVFVLITGPFITFLEWEPREYIYYENLDLGGVNPSVDFYVVENASYIPCTSSGSGILIGCAFFDLNPLTTDYIYITEDDYVDPYGMGNLMHEILHVKCGCDWHWNELSRQMVLEQDEFSYRYIMQNKDLFQSLESLTGEN